MRHGPHQAAQKSTSTGSEESTALSNVDASASTIQGRGEWQKPQRGAPAAPTGRRLRLPQFVQEMTSARVMTAGARGAVPDVAPQEVGGCAAVSRDLEPTGQRLTSGRSGAHFALV